MKSKVLLISIVSILLFCSCSSEAQKSFESLYQEISQIDFEQSTPTMIKSLIDRIDNHVIKFPNFENNASLIEFKNKALIYSENMSFQEIFSQIDQLENSSFQDYESAISSFNQAKESLLSYIMNATIANNIEFAKSKIESIDKRLESINLEQSDYYNAFNATDVSIIEEFINKYPNSVMKNTLYEQIDNLFYSEYMNNINSNPVTIYELNQTVNRAKYYVSKFRNIDLKMQINEAIATWESQRHSILETELHNELQVLMEQMEDAAKTKAKRTHPTYEVEMCVARGSNPEVIGYSSTFERVYQVNLKGAFLGWDKREMVISIVGKIKGDLRNGVSTTITGSRVDSDRKF
jgi:hypothetical protein